MILHLTALLVLQASPVQYGAGIAIAPGGQLGPVLRVAQEWPVTGAVAFRVEGAFATAGAAGTHEACTIAQCFYSDFEYRAREFELPALLRVSVGPNGPLFFTAGPVFALRIACSGTRGSADDTCPNRSNLAWGGVLGAGLRLPIGARAITLETRYQHFATPLVQLLTSDSGTTQGYQARAWTVVVGWGRR